MLILHYVEIQNVYNGVWLVSFGTGYLFSG